MPERREPVRAEWIEAAESELGLEMPSTLKLWLRICSNGGTIRWNSDAWHIYPVFDKTDRRSIRRTSNNIVRANAFAKNYTDLRDDAWAIGQNEGGDYLVCLVGPGERVLTSEIYFADHETGEYARIAGDFIDLLPPHDRWVLARS